MHSQTEYAIGQSKPENVLSKETSLETPLTPQYTDNKIDLSPKQSRGSTRGVTLLVLIQEGILEPGKGVLSIDYLGNSFQADLTNDGKIYWDNILFASPSSWAMHIKKQMNPSKKSGCGWNSVKYKGKKLDVYKTHWNKKQLGTLPNEALNSTNNNERSSDERKMIKHSQLAQLQGKIDPETLIETLSCVEAMGHAQQFTIRISMNCKVLMDFHSHLSKNEVIGYLGGKWDSNKKCIQVVQAFPCKCNHGDMESAKIIERNIQNTMATSGLFKVGWYHSHPNCLPEPTLRDIECQLEFQTKFYPIIAIICSPFHPQGNMTSTFKIFSVSQCDNGGHAKPMNMQYEDIHENQLFHETIQEMSMLLDYYKSAKELINLNSTYTGNTTYANKLIQSLAMKTPETFRGGLQRFLTQFLSNSIN